MPYRAADGNASGWAIMMLEASPSAAARDSPSALMILARFPARPRPGDHGPFHGVVRRGGRIIPAEPPSFDLTARRRPVAYKENPGPPVLPRMLRGSSCQGPERYFDITILFGFSNLEWIILPWTAVPTGPPIHIGFRPPGNRCSQRLPRSFRIGLRLRFPECIIIRTSSCGTQLIDVGAKPPFA